MNRDFSEGRVLNAVATHGDAQALIFAAAGFFTDVKGCFLASHTAATGSASTCTDAALPEDKASSGQSCVCCSFFSVVDGWLLFRLVFVACIPWRTGSRLSAHHPGWAKMPRPFRRTQNVRNSFLFVQTLRRDVSSKIWTNCSEEKQCHSTFPRQLAFIMSFPDHEDDLVRRVCYLFGLSGTRCSALLTELDEAVVHKMRVRR